jgi:hypothetical protein
MNIRNTALISMKNTIPLGNEYFAKMFSICCRRERIQPGYVLDISQVLI